MLINSPNISGSLTVTGNAVITGSLTVAGGINATITGSATSASYVEYSNVANKPALVSGSSQVTYSGLTGVPSGIVSGSSQITYSGISSIPSGIVSGSSQVTYSGLTGVPSGIVSGSSQVTYSGLTGVPAGIVSSSTQIEGYSIFATTGSNQFNGSQAVTGSLTVTGQVVAQTLNVQQVTSSIVYSSGSNIFGNSLGNTQQFTGSVSVTGSLTVNGAGTFASSVDARGNIAMQYDGTAANQAILSHNGTSAILYASGNTTKKDFTIYRDGGVDAGLIIKGSNGNVGIGTTSPASQATGATTGILDVSAATGGNLVLHRTGSGDTALFSILKSTNGTYIDSTGAATAANNAIYFRTNNINADQTSLTTALTIASTGNVGIGTTTPSRILSISQTNPYISLTSTTNSREFLVGVDSNGYVIYDATAAAYRMIISSGGNIGIGTTSPGTKLEVSSTAPIGDRTLPHNILTLTAEQGNAPYSFFGGAILFKNRSYVSGLVESSRIRSVIYDDGSPNNFGGGLWFETTPTPGGTLTPSVVINYQGRVGIGTTSPGELLTFGKAGGGQVFQAKDTTTNYDIGYIQFNTDNITLNPQGGVSGTTGYFRFVTAGTEKMRITSGGAVLVNETAVSSQGERFAVTATNLAAMFKTTGGAANNWAANFWNNATSGNNLFIEFGTETSYAGRGSVTYNRGSGVVAYNTTSDYRIKTEIEDFNALDIVSNLKPKEFKIGDAEQKSIGFIAHELQEFFPQAVHGEKDAEDENEKPIYQGVDYSQLTGLLTKAIQEQQTQIEILKTKIEILEQS